MSAPVSIDVPEFAHRAEAMAGETPVVALPRVRELLAKPEGDVRYECVGAVRRDGKPSIRLHVAASVWMVCQRCLAPVRVDIESDRELVFVPEAALGDVADEESDADYLPLGGRVSPMELVEDELLLSLPLAPKHADADEGCVAVGGVEPELLN
jgi:uncharacterized protein